MKDISYLQDDEAFYRHERAIDREGYKSSALRNEECPRCGEVQGLFVCECKEASK